MAGGFCDYVISHTFQQSFVLLRKKNHNFTKLDHQAEIGKTNFEKQDAKHKVNNNKHATNEL